jgi:transcription elongation factor Elf1
MARPFKCPYCGQSRSVSKGVRKTKTMGNRRIRLCKACNRKFTPRSQKAVPQVETTEDKEPAPPQTNPNPRDVREANRPVESEGTAENAPGEEGPLLDALDRPWTS